MYDRNKNGEILYINIEKVNQEFNDLLRKKQLEFNSSNMSKKEQTKILEDMIEKLQ